MKEQVKAEVKPQVSMRFLLVQYVNKDFGSIGSEF
jgi:hypothetical protein